MNSRKRKILHQVSVIDNLLLKEGVYYLKIDKIFDFKPGQVIAVALALDNEPRLYSIASGIDEDFIGILFDINPQGQLTPSLAELKTSDHLFISEPFGKFLCEHKPAIWIATGTGIAPFLSLGRSNKADDVTLIHGSRTLDSFYYQETFISLLGENYKRFCTTEEDAGVYNGRLTTYLKNQKQLPTNYKYYLCGNSQMIIDVREILIEKGVPFDHIIAEIYF